MSMFRQIEIQATNKKAIEKAIKKLGWRLGKTDNHHVGYKTVKGIKVHTDTGWFVIDTEGKVCYDNDEIKAKQIHKFTARYGAEKAKMDAIKEGYNVQEIVKDGKIKLIATEA